jgi:hypothetical protein
MKVIVIFILGFIQSAASQNIVLKNFSAQQINLSVKLDFILEQGSTCNGITIQRAGNNFLFYDIGEIQGICGNPGYDVPYTFTDNAPISNRTNYYRLIFSGNTYSDTINIHYFDYGKSGIVILPNPVSDYADIYFKGASGKKYFYSVYTFYGAEVEQKEFKGTHISFSRKNLEQGTYRLMIRDERDILYSHWIVVMK